MGVGTGFTLDLSFDDDPARFAHVGSGAGWWSQAWQPDTTVRLAFDNGYYVDSNHMAVFAFLYPNRVDFGQITLSDTNLPLGLGSATMSFGFVLQDGTANSMPLDLTPARLASGFVYLSVDNNVEETYPCNSPEGECYRYHDGYYDLSGSLSSVPLPAALPLLLSALAGLFTPRAATRIGMRRQA